MRTWAEVQELVKSIEQKRVEYEKKKDEFETAQSIYARELDDVFHCVMSACHIITGFGK